MVYTGWNVASQLRRGIRYEKHRLAYTLYSQSTIKDLSMNIQDRFLEYAEAFEITYEDNDAYN